MSKKLFAIGYLGWNFFKLLFKKILFFPPRKKKQLLQAYKADHIFPISSTERLMLPEHSLCINCRICDISCPQINSNDFTSPSFIVTSASRDLSTYYLYNSDLHYCKNCSICEEVCPSHVPIKNIIDFIQKNSQLRY